MTGGPPATWTGAIEASPFDWSLRTTVGTSGEWPRSTRRRTGGLLWHGLAPSGPARSNIWGQTLAISGRVG